MMEIIDEELREAAKSGNVEFLQKCVDDNKPNHYYLTLFPERDDDYCCGNIFHIAAREEQEEWIREAINLLPVELVHQLICQPYPEVANWNPLHLAADMGNLKIVKMFLNAFTSHHLPLPIPNPPPWLIKDVFGFTPCHVALYREKEECGLEILRMDTESLSNMLNKDGWSLLALAIENGQEKVAMEIISSPYSFSASAPDGESALFYMPNCSSSPERGKEICNSLLKKMPELIRKKRDTNKMSIFHKWAMIGKLWPFECLLESSDIIPDIRHVFVELISATDDGGKNPLHYLPWNSISIEDAQIGKLLIDTYKHEHGEEAQSSSNISPRELQYPWLVKDKRNKTPLDYAVDKGKEELANTILTKDKNALKTCQENVLFVAIEKRFEEVLLKILEIVNEEKLTHLLTNDQKLNALHLAPKCKRNFCERLIEQHPVLIEGVSKERETILHTWVKIGQVWPFEYLLNNSKIENKWRYIFINSLRLQEKTKNNNALHIVATCTNESTLQIVKLLLQAYNDLFGSLCTNPFFFDTTPWIMKNKDGEGALHVAIRCQKDQKLALYLLSLQPDGEDDELMAKWLDIYAPNEHSIIFLAIQRKFFDVVKTIFSKLNKERWSKYLQDLANDNNNVLHLASTCTDAELGQFLVEEAPEFISQQNKNGITPLEVACEGGATRILKAMLEKAPWAFDIVPLAWVKACELGNLSIIEVFIKCYPQNFSQYCLTHKNSPLHHIKLQNSLQYEDFFNIPYMKDLINVQDVNGRTPLHKAIEDKNILLVETLLKMDKIRYDIKDHNGESVATVLEKGYEEQPEYWGHLYKSIEPILLVSYFGSEMNISEVRNTLSVVAALLATITFTAGFTLPSGFDQEKDQTITSNTAAFLVFSLSNTMAMCLSMVVLICLIWSMVFERNKSIYLIDRSLGLLRAAIYFTLMAFVTGVYVVVSPKSMWAAIVIVVMCSLVGFSVSRTLLFNVLNRLDKLSSSVKKKCTDPLHSMELGLPLLCHRGESSNENHTSTREEGSV